MGGAKRYPSFIVRSEDVGSPEGLNLVYALKSYTALNRACISSVLVPSRRPNLCGIVGILLAFAPFIAFAVVDRLIGPTGGLIAGALTSAALLIRDWASAGKTLKILEVGTFILFGGLALYALLVGLTWTIVGVRLRVDAGLLIVVLITMAVGRPFTLQYAREQVAPALRA